MSSSHLPTFNHYLPVVIAGLNLGLLLYCLARFYYAPITPPDGTRWILSIVIPSLFAIYGYRRKSISLSGVVAGFLVGVSLTLGSYTGIVCLIVCFLGTSWSTKFRGSLKSKFEAEFREGGQRNWIQVYSNCGVATIAILLKTFFGGSRETVIDFERHYWDSWFLLSAICGLSCALGDTLSSELGPVISPETEPILITAPWRSVPKGTNGGVTWAGLIASAFGGTLIGLTAYLTIRLLGPSPPENWPQYPVVIFGFYSGLVGSICDSILGATVQYSGYDHWRNRVVDEPKDSTHVEFISGRHWLDNHSVNLTSIAAMAFLWPSLALVLWPHGESIF